MRLAVGLGVVGGGIAQRGGYWVCRVWGGLAVEHAGEAGGVKEGFGVGHRNVGMCDSQRRRARRNEDARKKEGDERGQLATVGA